MLRSLSCCDGLLHSFKYIQIYPSLKIRKAPDMLNQAAGDRAILAKQLNISPQQMKYVTHTEAGEGLIFYGNVVLPFVDRFPKDTELYRVMTTKPEEVGKA